MSNFRSLPEYQFPIRYTLNEWQTDHSELLRNAEENCKLADRVRAESCRVQSNTGTILERNKEDTNDKLRERICQEEFRKAEIESARTSILCELEPASAMKIRVIAALKYLESTGYQITTRCINLREGRIGIDLTHDDVEKELLLEKKTIQGALSILKRSLDQIVEIERELRASIYFLNKDLKGKDTVLSIDNDVLHMKETDIGLCVYRGGSDELDVANVSLEEWQKYTDEKFLSLNKKINKSRILRTYLNTLLKQVEQDLKNQDRAVNLSLSQRIEQVQQAKKKLELQHFEIVRQANEMHRTVADLEKDIAVKESYLALAHTRLGKRAQRPGVELVRDNANIKLNNEVVDAQEVFAQLRQNLAQAQAIQRKLLQTQVKLEEEINVKINSLKIDEVDVMTLRQSIRHQEF